MKSKTILTIVLFCTLLSCSSVKIHDYYSGFVIEEAGKPISEVLVREEFVMENNTTTDSTGYFKFKRTENWISNLIFSKSGYKTDTVRTVWTPCGERIEYSEFLTKDSSKIVLYPEIGTNSFQLMDELQDTIINDTLFLVREKSANYYHAIFIDTSKSSRFYEDISCFDFDEYDEDTYNQSLEYLKKNNIILKRQIINELPLKWIACRQYKKMASVLQ